MPHLRRLRKGGSRDYKYVAPDGAPKRLQFFENISVSPTFNHTRVNLTIKKIFALFAVNHFFLAFFQDASLRLFHHQHFDGHVGGI